MEDANAGWFADRCGNFGNNEIRIVVRQIHALILTDLQHGHFEEKRIVIVEGLLYFEKSWFVKVPLTYAVRS